eukprot:8594830-Prorocentrum_lima.AAC.1
MVVHVAVSGAEALGAGMGLEWPKKPHLLARAATQRPCCQSTSEDGDRGSCSVSGFPGGGRGRL